MIRSIGLEGTKLRMVGFPRPFCASVSRKVLVLESLLQEISNPSHHTDTDERINLKFVHIADQLSSEDSFDLLSALQAYSGVIERHFLSSVSLKVCDSPDCLQSVKDLLLMGDFSTSKVNPPDYALLSCVVNEARNRLALFSSAEITGLLGLCARVDFVDSDFNESMQQYIPTVLGNFSDNHFPALFASSLRLGLDQPVDRIPIDDKTSSGSSQYMELLIKEMITRVSKLSDGGCLAILHSIVRRPKGKISSEMETMVKAISETVDFDQWNLAMRIQAVHALSRLGIENHSAIESLFRAVDPESITKIPSANLQHLLSIIHNHSAHHDASLCNKVLTVCMQRIAHPAIAKSMPMATVAVTIGYFGRLGLRNDQTMNSLLKVFAGSKVQAKTTQYVPIEERVTEKFVWRILSDPQVDVAHLTGILEAIDRLNMWHLPLSVPLLLITRRLILKDGIHNVRTAPLSIVCQCLLRADFGLRDNKVSLLDSQIDQFIKSCIDKSGNWALKSDGELPIGNWRKMTVLALLEGLLKHEQYIRSSASPSVIDRCMQIRESLSPLLRPEEIPDKVSTFMDTLNSHVPEARVVSED